VKVGETRGFVCSGLSPSRIVVSDLVIGVVASDL
jgi:hypothetical protein